MSNTAQRRPPLALLIAALLIVNGILGLWALLQTVMGTVGFVSVPSLSNKSGSAIAYTAIGIGFVCFLIAGIALLRRRRYAIALYVAGASFYAIYFVVGIALFFLGAALDSLNAGKFSASDLLYLAAVLLGGALLGFIVARAIYKYLVELLQSGVLR